MTQLQVQAPLSVVVQEKIATSAPDLGSEGAARAKQTETAWHRSLAGGAAGFTSRLVVAPFDVIKIRFQTQIDTVLPFPSRSATTTSTRTTSIATPTSARRPTLGVVGPKYRTVVQALTTVWQEEGIVGLWRGSFPGLLLWISYASVQFPLYSYLKRTFKMPDNASTFTHTGYNLGEFSC
jgi:solute carrier family 25 thiamine pyrophosphate transporter 19